MKNRGDDDKSKAKKIASNMYAGDNYYPSDYFKPSFQSDDDVYAAAAAAVAAAANNMNVDLMHQQQQNPNRLSYLSATSESNNFWKPTDNMSAYATSRFLSNSHHHLNGYHLQQQQQQQQAMGGTTTTWPRNTEL